MYPRLIVIVDPTQPPCGPTNVCAASAYSARKPCAFISRRQHSVPCQTANASSYIVRADALRAAHQNLEEAGIRETVDLKQCNALEASPPEKEGILVANLPYGERMGDEDELAELYPKLGDVFKKKFGGWNAYLFTADLRIVKLMRLTPTRRVPLFNGAIECRLFEYRIVAGSNRPKQKP